MHETLTYPKRQGSLGPGFGRVPLIGQNRYSVRLDTVEGEDDMAIPGQKSAMNPFFWSVLFIGALTGCSHETLERTGYETLRNLNENVGPCAPSEGYDDYQRQRKELEEPRQ